MHHDSWDQTSRIGRRCNRIRHVARLRFRRDAVWRRTIVEIVRVPKASIDNFTRGWVNSAGLSNRVR